MKVASAESQDFLWEPEPDPIIMTDEAESLRSGYEWADVLVVVKTYPAPSEAHGETVCVAGVRLDGREAPSWIRLYPISFRALEADDQFRKYQRIRIPIRSRGSYDPRPESFQPDVSKLRVDRWYDTKGNWEKRSRLIGPLRGQTTTCDLIAQNRAGKMSDSIPSLALVRAHVRDVTIETGKPWTERQLAKVRKFSAADLFNPEGRKELQPVPFQLRISYTCDHPECSGHEPSLIDWELGVMGLRWPQRYGNDTAQAILRKFRETLDDSVNDVHLIIGNQHQHRATFSVCGIWAPKISP